MPLDTETTTFPFSLEELKALYKLFEHQYIPYENQEGHAVVDKISKIIRQHESKPELD